ncbi:aspartate kinase [Flavobacteriaceae bacterium UJ101]|nr:aspartate kinase [Flavobacteriaceae bacterium UJ101]
MKVLKFGGTSVGNVENMRQVMKIVNDGEQKIVVLSAMAGTTNFLVELYELTKKRNEGFSVKHKIDVLKEQYIDVVENLYKTDVKKEAMRFVRNRFGKIYQAIDENPRDLEGYILAQGEILSTRLFTYLLKENNIDAECIPALEFMRIDMNGEPDRFFIKKTLGYYMERYPATIYVTQGYICRDFYGRITNLKRGGSDYTASIIGSRLRADNIQIWTDVDGFQNNDPRYVKKTQPISELSFEEAAELAYFGAKILHPQTVFPAQRRNIPVYLKNTLDPKAKGTRISSDVKANGVKAIAAKDGITAIKIKSERMLHSHGYLHKIFEVFSRHETPIDMITTSEVAVSLTIDNAKNLDKIVPELENFAKIEVDQEQSIVCLVGHEITKSNATYKLFGVLKDHTVRMISYGGSSNNISILVDTDKKVEVLNKLHKLVF